MSFPGNICSSLLGLLFAQQYFQLHEIIRETVSFKKAMVMGVLCLRIQNTYGTEAKIQSWKIGLMSAGEES